MRIARFMYSRSVVKDRTVAIIVRHRGSRESVTRDFRIYETDRRHASPRRSRADPVQDGRHNLQVTDVRSCAHRQGERQANSTSCGHAIKIEIVMSPLGWRFHEMGRERNRLAVPLVPQRSCGVFPG